ncbi:hypothetical protein EYF80_020733 [Liparis tanakae]|uniref:Uncharacterized protein n=1 Tax=Liparis tanakae TaxID=230148 RepID=A0A4Z2HTP5_9TELE|nr:hypothetical protein EYF80_020733 [Liparis tanakae]
MGRLHGAARQQEAVERRWEFYWRFPCQSVVSKYEAPVRGGAGGSGGRFQELPIPQRSEDL